MSPESHKREALPPEVMALITTLARELASELDLHYEEEDFSALEPSVDPLITTKNLLEENGAAVPEVVAHVLRRFRRNYN